MSDERVHAPARHRRRPRRWGWAIGLVAVVGLLAGGFALLRPQASEPSLDTTTDTVELLPVASPEGADPTPTLPAFDEVTAGDPTPLSSVRLDEVRPSTGSTNGGEAVVIAGAGFAEPMTVRIGGRDAPFVEVLSEQTLRVVTPPGSPGPAAVELVGIGEPGIAAGDLFAYAEQEARVVMAVRPNVGTSAGGTAITIVGTGFLPGARVVIGGERAREVEVLDSTRITALTPPHDLGLVDVVVRNPDLPAAILPAAFEFVVGPTVTVMEPSDISMDGGTEFMLTGTGFEPGVEVTINGLPATDVQVMDGETLRAVAPRGVVGPATLVVINPGQPPASLLDVAFYVLPLPPTPEPAPIESAPSEVAPADPGSPGVPEPAAGEAAPAAG